MQGKHRAHTCTEQALGAALVTRDNGGQSRGGGRRSLRSPQRHGQGQGTLCLWILAQSLARWALHEFVELNCIKEAFSQAEQGSGAQG